MSVRLLQRIIGGVISTLPTSLKEVLEHHSGGDQETFPSLPIAAEIGDYQEEEEGALLSFRTPQLAEFGEVFKKELYNVCVKDLHRTSLDVLKKSWWLGLLVPGPPPQGSWRSLYKPPIEKRTEDLQWRNVHGAVAANRHVAHIDPTIGSQGKLAVWLSRQNKIQGSVTLDPEPMLRPAVRIRLMIEDAYFKMTHNLPAFNRVWGQGWIMEGRSGWNQE
ncbi:hypothetical protein SRHO_G00033840 [Serrasalmus rhombeus]